MTGDADNINLDVLIVLDLAEGAEVARIDRTYAMNLLGGWLVAAMVVVAYPELHGVGEPR